MFDFVARDVPKLLSKCSVVVLLQMMTCWTRGFPRACSLSPYLVGQKRLVVCLLSETVKEIPSSAIRNCIRDLSLLCCLSATGRNPNRRKSRMCPQPNVSSQKTDLREVRNTES